MRYLRTTLGLALTILVTAWIGGPCMLDAQTARASADSSPAAGGFGAPDHAELHAARELPERLTIAVVAGNARPAPIPRLAPEAPARERSAGNVPATPLYLRHCAFLC